MLNKTVSIAGRTFDVDEMGRASRKHHRPNVWPDTETPFEVILTDLRGGPPGDRVARTTPVADAAIFVHDTIDIALCIATDLFGANVSTDVVFAVYDRLIAKEKATAGEP